MPLLVNSFTGEYYITEAEKEAGYEELLIGKVDLDYSVEGAEESGVNELPVGYNVTYVVDKKMFVVDGKNFSVEDGWKCRSLLDPLFVIDGFESRIVEVMYNINTNERYIPQYAQEYENTIKEHFDRMIIESEK